MHAINQSGSLINRMNCNILQKKQPYTPSLLFGDALFERSKKHGSTHNDNEIYDSSKRLVRPSKIEQAKSRAQALIKTSKAILRQSLEALQVANKRRKTDLTSLPETGSVNLKNENKNTLLENEKKRKEAAIEIEIGKIQLANLALAEDKSPSSNLEARDDLDNSIEKLKELEYFNKSEIHPQVIHGVANLGSYTHANDIFSLNKEAYGDVGNDKEESSFEGMTINLKSVHNTEKEVSLKSNIKKNLPMLDLAIELSKKMQGSQTERKFAESQYLTLKGESLHALSHLRSDEPDEISKYQNDARNSFLEAIKLNKEIPSTERKDAHNEALKQLQSVKAPHLCQNVHIPSSFNERRICTKIENSYLESKLSSLNIPNLLQLNPSE